jgi:hypothetical protein
VFANRKTLATPSELRRIFRGIFYPGFKANAPTPRGLPARGPRPGLELANAFSVKDQKSPLVVTAPSSDTASRTDLLTFQEVTCSAISSLP